MTISEPRASLPAQDQASTGRISRIDEILDAGPAAGHVRLGPERFSCTSDAPASWQLESARHRDPDFNNTHCQYGKIHN
jgi:hypothetical protein